MARLILSAAAQPTMQDARLIVSVSGADDGLPRRGLAATNFDVVVLASGADPGPQQQLIAQAVEGPPANRILQLFRSAGWRIRMAGGAAAERAEEQQ